MRRSLLLVLLLSCGSPHSADKHDGKVSPPPAASASASARTLVADAIARTLAAPLDFSANESIETDPKKLAFCKTEEELAARWRGVLKLQVLERTQQLEETLERRAHPKPEDKPVDAEDAKREAA